MKRILFLIALIIVAPAVWAQQLDSTLLEQIQELVNQIEQIRQQVPDTISSQDDLEAWYTLIWGIVTIFGTYVFRASQTIISFIGKIKSNGVLAIIAAIVASAIGLWILPAGELTWNTVFVFVTSVLGSGTLIYNLLNWIFKDKLKTPQPEETPQPAPNEA